MRNDVVEIALYAVFCAIFVGAGAYFVSYSVDLMRFLGGMLWMH